MSDTSQVETAARAVVAALDFRSSSESRQAATTYLESLKAGDVQLLGATAAALVKQSSWSSEVRHYGFKMLQYLVRMRWEELSTEHRTQLAEMVVGLVPEIAMPHEEWVLKSQTAALVAEVVRREGASLWQGLLFKLFDLATASPAHAELVVMVLRWLPEDVTVYNEDLEGKRRRELLLGLTQSLPQILPLFYKLLDLHFGQAVKLLQHNQLDIARQHAAVVTATLNALLAYTEWAPVNDLASHGLIEACGYLLNAVDFRLGACDFLKQIASRRRPTDDSASLFDAALIRVFESLSHASGAFQNGASMENNENDLQFAECLCEAMVAVGLHNLQCIAGLEDHLTLYLRQMLGFLQHDKVRVHYPALLLWLTLLRETPSAPDIISEDAPMNDGVPSGGRPSGISGVTEKDKKGVSVIISDEVYATLSDLAFHWLLKKSCDKTVSNDGPVRSDEDLSSSGDYSNHRGRLLELVRLVAVQRPILAVSKISQKIHESCGSSTSIPNSLAFFEGTQRLLENIIHAIFDGVTVSAATLLPELQTNLEGILKVLLLAKWNDPAFVEIHGRCLDAMGPYLRISPAAAVPVVEKLFELLATLPIISKGFGQDPVALVTSRARLQVCTSFLRIAKAADSAVSPHMEVIWKTVAGLQQQGLLLQGEHNLIAEAFLIVGSAAGEQCQVQVLDWFLRPLKDKWGQSDWQNRYLSTPGALVELLTRGPTEGRLNEEMWSIFHSVTFFERVLKRCVIQHPNQTQTGMAVIEPSSFSHPMMGHLLWMIPPLLQLIRCVHSFCSPSIKCLLPDEVQGALLMSAAEQASLIGEAGSKTLRSVDDNDTNAGAAVGSEGKESEIRNWLRGVRDSGYSIIGLAASRFSDIFFGYMDCTAVEVAFLENIEAMEFRHIRHLLHSVIIPVVKACPSSQWEVWLGELLPQLLIHCEQALSVSWMNLIREGAVTAPDVTCKSGGLGLKTEVMEEKMLRDLSRETCALLAVLASPSLNTNLPSAEQLLQPNQMELSGGECSSQFGSGCMMRFLMQHQDIATAALSICNHALKWPDSEAVHKAILFCGAIVTVAAISSDIQLQNFVARDLFSAVIEALTIESNAPAQADLVNLFRIIYLHLATRNEGPRQILQSLPSITVDALVAFENALSKTSSAKEQKQHVKSLLLLAGGNYLKALVTQKSATVITNVSNRAMGPSRAVATKIEETGVIGLAAII